MCAKLCSLPLLSQKLYSFLPYFHIFLPEYINSYVAHITVTTTLGSFTYSQLVAANQLYNSPSVDVWSFFLLTAEIFSFFYPERVQSLEKQLRRFAYLTYCRSKPSELMFELLSCTSSAKMIVTIPY